MTTEKENRTYLDVKAAMYSLEQHLLEYVEQLEGRVPDNTEIQEHARNVKALDATRIDFYWKDVNVASLCQNLIPMEGCWLWRIELLAIPGA